MVCVCWGGRGGEGGCGLIDFFFHYEFKFKIFFYLGRRGEGGGME